MSILLQKLLWSLKLLAWVLTNLNGVVLLAQSSFLVTFTQPLAFPFTSHIMFLQAR